MVLLSTGCVATSRQDEETLPASLALARESAALERQIAETERLLSEIPSLRLVGMDDGEVPAFTVHDTNGKLVESSSWVGKQAFAIVFFTTWCTACDALLEDLGALHAPTSSMPLVFVTMDEPADMPEAASLLGTRGLGGALVAAQEHSTFAFSYNYFSVVPLVVVVGRNGGLVDYVLGYEPGSNERLLRAFDLAGRIGPLVGEGGGDRVP
jgi:thiol-disulfide isomerase/thioredoxin